MFRCLHDKYDPGNCSEEITVAMRMHTMYGRIKEAYRVLKDEAAKGEQC